MRVGKKFELGYPYVVSRGICYFWPGSRIDYDLFKGKREELSEFLLEKTKDYLEEFKIHTDIGFYPHLQIGEGGLAIHIGDEGRWIDFSSYSGGGLASSHNLDACDENFVAFNIASDTIEFLDSEFKAPRILKGNDYYNLEYPLPDGSSVFPTNKESTTHIFTKKYLKIFKDFKNGEDITDIITKKDFQQIKTRLGDITIQHGVCLGTDFKRWDVYKASFLISVLFGSFN